MIDQHDTQPADVHSGTADPVLDLLTLTGDLSAAGRGDEAEQRFRSWLASGHSPLRYAVEFNLAVLLETRGADTEAEAALRRCVALRPGFAAAWLRLGLLLARQGRGEQALGCYSTTLGSMNAAAEAGMYKTALNLLGQQLDTMGRADAALKMYARSLLQDPAQPEVAARAEALRARRAASAPAPETARISDPEDVRVPLVSLVIPTCHGPDDAERALNSALAQSYLNLEIIVIDHSSDDSTQQRLLPALAAHPCVRYKRSAGALIDPMRQGLALARGHFVNFLLDQDEFHPHKIERMMDCLLGQSRVALVTSACLLTDAQGQPLPASAPLLATPGVVGGGLMLRHVLQTGLNVVGEASTVLFRKADLREPFGQLFERDYEVLGASAAWLSMLTARDCVYLPDALSRRRTAAPTSPAQQLRGAAEQLRLLSDLAQRQPALLEGCNVGALAAERLTHFISLLGPRRVALADAGLDAVAVHSVLQSAAQVLLGTASETSAVAAD